MLNIVILGLAITSSWGNGHATTYRALVREISRRGHRVLFLERDVPWYASERDLPASQFCDIGLYADLKELRAKYRSRVRDADVVIVGSYVPEGIKVGEWVCRTAGGLAAFYDIDTPVTLGLVEKGQCEYLNLRLIRKYGVYLSFTGGPTLKRLEKHLGARRARPLHCSADPTLYFPVETRHRWDLGYLGTYSADRQPALDKLMLAPARSWLDGRFIVAGPQYPQATAWPKNTRYVSHLPPGEHRDFYCSQRFTLNITRADMLAAGYSPSVRLFEAAACGVPIISDDWEGIESFFEPGLEVLIARDSRDSTRFLRELPEAEREAIGTRARQRVLESHTASHRAAELEDYLREAASR